MCNMVLGVDFGTDSARGVLIDAASGNELALAEEAYPRWKKGMYCDAEKSQFRQHPLDYLETLTSIISEIVQQIPKAGEQIRSIGIAMTGSTPVAVDRQGVPLALKPEFADYPNAMFVLWKDHTGQKENEQINKYSRSSTSDYTRSRVCGSYSVEHFWTKALHIFKGPKIREAAYSFVESSDWLPAELVGRIKPEQMKRGMGVATSRVLWNKTWGGYPPNRFFKDLDPVLDGLVTTFDPQPYTCDQPVGKLSKKWAERLGLNENVVVAAGSLDCHAGAIGAGVREQVMVEILGTSTVAITVDDIQEDKASIPGVPQQALDMILPGKVGYEGGQSSFGDLYAWFKEMLMWPVNQILMNSTSVDEATKSRLLREIDAKMIPVLTDHAGAFAHDYSEVIATDWINGRRSPNADFNLKGTIAGLTLSSTSPLIYKSLVEATAYGAKAFIEEFRNSGGVMKEVIAVGGISQKSPFVMQVLADVLGLPIKVLSTQRAGALGVAMCAATAAGIYNSLSEAQEAMKGDISTIYQPKLEHEDHYLNQYKKYMKLEGIKHLITT